MIILSDIDSSKYLCNPVNNNNIEHFLEKNNKVFTGTLDEQERIPPLMVMRYIILMYDINSEFRTRFPDYYTRKREVALTTGWVITKRDKFYNYIEDILIGRNPIVNTWIVNYILMFNDPDYLTLVAFSDMLMRETMVSLSPDYDKDTIANIQKLSKDIKMLQRNIFGGDPEKDLKKALYNTMEKQKLRLRPELIAEDISKNKLNLDNPYYSEL